MMSFIALHFEVERGEAKRTGPLGQPPKRSNRFALNFRQRAALRLHSCRALSSGRCARKLPAKTIDASDRYEKTKKTVTQKPESVTYVLSQECYRCPDCALPFVICALVICHFWF
jgi:hypothetical protein